MKKYYILLSLTLCLIGWISGCHAGVISTAPTSAAQESTVTVTTAARHADATTETTETTAATGHTAITTEATTVTKSTTTAKATATTKPTVTIKATTAKKATTASRQSPTTAKTTVATTVTKQSPVATTSQPAPANQCTFSIECQSLLRHPGRLKPGHEAYVPADGFLLAPQVCTFTEGETVYDLLQRMCRQNSITLSEKKSPYGVYIAGIGQLDEKDAGSESGWLYYVNGRMPMTSCNNYQIKSKDVIVFHYTCEKGD